MLARSLVLDWALVCTVGITLVLTVEALKMCLWFKEVELKVTKNKSPWSAEIDEGEAAIGSLKSSSWSCLMIISVMFRDPIRRYLFFVSVMCSNKINGLGML